jgi:predicted TIM-barrel fold metal-dependent hydrolase
VIIDTETHVLIFSWPHSTNPSQSMVKHHTWHEHSGDLLVAEMDNAGVDKTILISYDIEDVIWAWERKGFGIEDMAGGKKYTRAFVEKYPDRFIWFTTIKPPRRADHLEVLREDIAAGVKGVKLFPAHMERRMDDPDITAVFELCEQRDLPALVSFENVHLSDIQGLPEYFEQTATVLEQFPTVRLGLMHAGCADPLTSAAESTGTDDPDRLYTAGSTFPTGSTTVSNQLVIDMMKQFPNLYLSTAAPGNIWDDGSEYPFPNYLRRIQLLVESVGADRLMWATDWPWLEHEFKYEQAVNAIRRHAPFLSDDEKAMFLGGAAAAFLDVKDRLEHS